MKCENSTEHQAVKYTCLGPFCPGWKLKCTQNQNEMMPSTLDAYLLVSHLTEGSSVPLWTSAQYHIDVQVISLVYHDLCENVAKQVQSE